MIDCLKSKFSSPFPYSRGVQRELFSNLLTCTFVTIALIILRPFGLDETPVLIIFGFGLAMFTSTILNVLFSIFLLSRLVDEEKWSVGKETIRALFFLSINVVAIILFAMVQLNIEFELFIILKFVVLTILFAIIPLSIRLIKTSNSLLRARLEEVKKMEHILEKKNPDYQEEVIEIKSNIVNDSVITDTSKLLFIEAEKNYINIIDLNDNKPQKKLLRLSLVKAHEQILNDNIIRCHRSYLVNVRAVQKVTGNSQGLKLVFMEDLKPIPVSRTYKEEVMAKIASLKMP